MGEFEIPAVYSIEEIKKRVIPILKSYPIQRAWIFGSYARGDACADSDLDVAVRVCDGERMGKYTLLYDPIAQALGKDVDIFDIRQFKDDKFMDGAIQIYDRGD